MSGDLIDHTWKAIYVVENSAQKRYSNTRPFSYNDWTAWGGRVSDRLKTFFPGDIVLADRGFNIAESVGMMQARLHIPGFTKGKDQLSAAEVQKTRTIANVRIHVERVIGMV